MYDVRWLPDEHVSDQLDALRHAAKEKWLCIDDATCGLERRPCLLNNVSETAQQRREQGSNMIVIPKKRKQVELGAIACDSRTTSQDDLLNAPSTPRAKLKRQRSLAVW